VEDNQDDGYATRRAELEERYQALPPAGSADYWQRIEEADTSKRLPLEVLARCFRERNSAGVANHADRILEVIFARVRVSLERWSARIASQAKSGTIPQLREELEQECHMKLWGELAAEGPTFLLENFAHKLEKICGHVAQSLMEQAGHWQRRDVAQPTRIPTALTSSMDQQPASEDIPPLADLVPDQSAAKAFDLAEWSDLFREVDQLPREARAIIYGTFYEGRTQQELAAELGVTDRTIRKRLKEILAQLRARYQASGPSENDGQDGLNGQHGQEDGND
jgi:RNA polymerase sigma factor (sigma-70 family)